MQDVKTAVSKLDEEAALKYARCRSATYRALKKDDNLWNDMTDSPKKAVKKIYTDKVVKGEDEAVLMISKRKKTVEIQQEAEKESRLSNQHQIKLKRFERHKTFQERCSSVQGSTSRVRFSTLNTEESKTHALQL